MMFFKLSRSSKIKRILVVSLSNIGDVILTLPVVDVLRAAFPSAELDLIVSPKTKSLFDHNASIGRVIAYDKKMSWRQNLVWFMDLRRIRFDLVVDLRNSMLPLLLNAGTVTFPALFPPKVHMRDKHLARLRQVFDGFQLPVRRSAITVSSQHRQSVGKLVQGWKDYVLIAPGAADPRKRWSGERFLQVARHVRAKGKRIILVGDEKDRDVSSFIMAAIPEGVLDLCGQTTLVQLAGVIEGASLALTNDSGIMHLASYFDRPVIALFGRTDPFFYGPWSSRCIALRKGPVIDAILSEDVLAEVDKFLC